MVLGVWMPINCLQKGQKVSPQIDNKSAMTRYWMVSESFGVFAMIIKLFIYRWSLLNAHTHTHRWLGTRKTELRLSYTKSSTSVARFINCEVINSSIAWLPKLNITDKHDRFTLPFLCPNRPPVSALIWPTCSYHMKSINGNLHYYKSRTSCASGANELQLASEVYGHIL